MVKPYIVQINKNIGILILPSQTIKIVLFGKWILFDYQTEFYKFLSLLLKCFISINYSETGKQISVRFFTKQSFNYKSTNTAFFHQPLLNHVDRDTL